MSYKFVKHSELADYLKVSKITIARMVRHGELPFIRVGIKGTKYFNLDEIMKLIEEKYN